MNNGRQTYEVLISAPPGSCDFANFVQITATFPKVWPLILVEFHWLKYSPVQTVELYMYVNKLTFLFLVLTVATQTTVILQKLSWKSKSNSLQNPGGAVTGIPDNICSGHCWCLKTHTCRLCFPFTFVAVHHVVSAESYCLKNPLKTSFL